MNKAGLALQEPLKEWKVLLEVPGHRSKEEWRAIQRRPLLQAPHKHSYQALDLSRRHTHSVQITQTTQAGPHTWPNNEPEMRKS